MGVIIALNIALLVRGTEIDVGETVNAKSPTLSNAVEERVMKPSVAITGNEYCPGRIEELVLTVREETDEPPEGTGTLGGEKLEHFAPTGRVPQENVKVL